jgi:hypothetical protein
VRLLALAAAVLALLLVGSSAFAQAPSPDAKAIAAYRLTDTGLNRFISASRGLAAVQRARPDADDADDDDDDDGDDDKDPSIDELAAIYERDPAARRALSAAGITSREYIIFSLSLFEAGMAAWLIEQHGWDKLPPNVARENVVFYQRNKARIDSVTAEIKSREGTPPQL